MQQGDARIAEAELDRDEPPLEADIWRAEDRYERQVYGE